MQLMEGSIIEDSTVSSKYYANNKRKYSCLLNANTIVSPFPCIRALLQLLSMEILERLTI